MAQRVALELSRSSGSKSAFGQQSGPDTFRDRPLPKLALLQPIQDRPSYPVVPALNPIILADLFIPLQPAVAVAAPSPDRNRPA
jgi:hypothetical protein